MKTVANDVLQRTLNSPCGLVSLRAKRSGIAEHWR